MRYTTLFFDLDDTLYPSSNGLWDAIRTRMSLYMHERVGLPLNEVPSIRRNYFETYGTTLRGLQIHHQVNADDYLAYVHDLALEEYLEPNPELVSILTSLPQKKWIFTNADGNHARRVIEFLGLSGSFEGVIDLRAIDFACKPEMVAFQRALAIAGNPNPAGCVLLDDSPANLLAARELGFTTVLVNLNGASKGSEDFTVHTLLALPQVLPGLWEGYQSV